MRIEAFFGRHHDAWRLYVRDWTPPMLRQLLDERGEAYPVAFDADELDAYMWELDAPYSKQATALGGLQVAARGRSADERRILAERLVGVYVGAGSKSACP